MSGPQIPSGTNAERETASQPYPSQRPLQVRVTIGDETRTLSPEETEAFLASVDAQLDAED